MKPFTARATKLLLLACIILAGAFFRLYRLTTLPPGIEYDPAYYGLDAMQILSGEFPVYFATNGDYSSRTSGWWYFN